MCVGRGSSMSPVEWRPDISPMRAGVGVVGGRVGAERRALLAGGVEGACWGPWRRRSASPACSGGLDRLEGLEGVVAGLAVAGCRRLAVVLRVMRVVDMG